MLIRDMVVVKKFERNIEIQKKIITSTLQGFSTTELETETNNNLYQIKTDNLFIKRIEEKNIYLCMENGEKRKTQNEIMYVVRKWECC